MILRECYRATFRFPIGPLNPMGLKLAVTMRVEVYQASKGRFQARCWDFEPPRPLPALGSHASSQQARNAAKQAFSEQVQPWEMWAKDAKDIFRQIHPEEVDMKPDGKVYLK